MKKLVFGISFLLFTVFLPVFSQQSGAQSDKIQVAFMADVHLQDIYGEFEDSEYRGIKNPGNSKYVIARTMQSQVHSTRIFNENYFAFLAALDDVARRNVKYVVLPGDFSDDGQPINVRGLKRILDDYSEKYGIRFILTTGNHDPVGPYSRAAGKTDFLGEGGKPQVIMSNEGMYVHHLSDELPLVITQDIKEMGYQEIISILSDYGFFPQESDFYWETPFSSYDYDSYTFEEGILEAKFENRYYTLPEFEVTIPDVSYLVEPIKDVWFLAIDANVYLPSGNPGSEMPLHDDYNTTGKGYNNVLTYKKHLIDWVARVASEAEKRGKTLIAFSHYPMVDYNDDATPHLKALLGEGKFQLHRVPDENVAEIFADAGIRLHFGGHLHINDTGVRKSKGGNTLVNVQIPSLAAYIPAYKLLTIHSRHNMEIETVVIDTVERFDELFPIYELEYDYLLSKSQAAVWNKEILKAKTYREFTSMHLKELVRSRFLKADWPDNFSDYLLNATGRDILEFSMDKQDALPKNIADYEHWNGFDMIVDLYRLRSADKLAIEDIGMQRIMEYEVIIDAFLARNINRTDELTGIEKSFFEFVKSFQHFLNGAPAEHFQIDISSGQIESK